MNSTLIERYRALRIDGCLAITAMRVAKQAVIAEAKRVLLNRTPPVWMYKNDSKCAVIGTVIVEVKNGEPYTDEEDFTLDAETVHCAGWGRDGRVKGRYAYGMFSWRHSNVIVLPDDMRLGTWVRGCGKQGSRQANVQRAVEAQNRWVEYALARIRGDVHPTYYTLYRLDEDGDKGEVLGSCGGYDDEDYCMAEAEEAAWNNQ